MSSFPIQTNLSCAVCKVKLPDVALAPGDVLICSKCAVALQQVMDKRLASISWVYIEAKYCPHCGKEIE